MENSLHALGTKENPWPRWALLKKDDMDEACYRAHDQFHTKDRASDAEFFCNDQICQESFVFERLISQLAAVVHEVEQTLRRSGRVDCIGFFAENILRIDRGVIYVKAFTCVNGRCYPPAESVLIEGIVMIMKQGWRNIEFDLEESTTE